MGILDNGFRGRELDLLERKYRKYIANQVLKCIRKPWWWKHSGAGIRGGVDKLTRVVQK